LRKSLLFAAIFIAFSSLCGNANASGHIYLLKGLAGIFSTGLDVLDQKLIQKDYSATVHSYLSYEELAAEAARLQKSGKGPIIIMGHSSGADAAISMADIMKTLGAPIALVVTFGPTTNLVAPSNVSQVINYYFGTIPVASGPGFRGTISNVDLSGDADIKQTPQLHRNVCFWGKADIVWKCGRKCGPIGSLLAFCVPGALFWFALYNANAREAPALWLRL
jgi:hypothetical protein